MLRHNWYLIGFMGAGKSFIGKALAKELSCPFFDLDTLIEAKAAKSIPQIFAEEGEASFRELERLCLEETSKLKPAIIALGGGTPCFHSNMAWLQANGKTIFLDMPAALLVDRLISETAQRPLLAGKNKANLAIFIEKKLQERRPFYQKANYTIKEPDHILAQIKTIMNKKTALLLLHGALGSKGQLEPLKEYLSENFEVYTLNFKGHGGAAMPERPFSIDLFTEDVLRFLEQNHLDKVDIFGYSMGGYVALNLAKKHPTKVGKIFTLATKFAWSPESSAKEVKMLNPEAIEAKVPAFAQALKERHAPLDWKEHLNKTAEMMLNLGNGDALTTDAFRGISNKVHLTVGSKDRMVSQEETKAIAEALPNGNFECLEDQAHPIEKVDLKLLSSKVNEFFNLQCT